MKPQIKKLWVAALRSGEYTQGIGRLRTDDNKFCCLGVLCAIHAESTPSFKVRPDPLGHLLNRSAIPLDVTKWSGVNFSYGDHVVIDGTSRCLSDHNDCAGATFLQLADAIESQL